VVAVAADLPALEQALRQRLGASSDIRFRPVRVAGRQGLLIFLEPVVDKAQLNRDLLGPIQALAQAESAGDLLAGINVADAAILKTEAGPIAEAVLAGEAVLIVGHGGAIRGSVVMPEHRFIAEPATENATRGARDSFTELLRSNLGLIRARIRDPRLRIETLFVGRRSRSRVAVIFLADVASPAVVKLVRERLAAIDVDTVGGDALLQEHLSDSRWSPFPLLRPTERPDWVAWEVLQGRVAILPEGSASALLGPATVADFYRSPEDYKHGFWEAAYVRAFLRLIAFAISVFLPGLYIALTDMTPELLPTKLALSIAGSREGVPFPAVVGVLFMEVSLELLRASALMMPRVLAPSVAIVGGIVLGQAAVQAKVVSDFLIIVMSLTAMAQFVPPSQEIAVAWRLIRWLFTLSAAFLGVYGLALVSFLVLFYMGSLTSLGVPYLAPLSAPHRSLLADGLLRAPFPLLRRRPASARPQDPDRVGGGAS
jgi:hypothetical protein